MNFHGLTGVNIELGLLPALHLGYISSKVADLIPTDFGVKETKTGNRNQWWRPHPIRSPRRVCPFSKTTGERKESLFIDDMLPRTHLTPLVEAVNLEGIGATYQRDGRGKTEIRIREALGESLNTEGAANPPVSPIRLRKVLSTPTRPNNSHRPSDNQ